MFSFLLKLWVVAIILVIAIGISLLVTFLLMMDYPLAGCIIHTLMALVVIAIAIHNIVFGTNAEIIITPVCAAIILAVTCIDEWVSWHKFYKRWWRKTL